MKNKKNIIIVILAVVILITTLWVSGVIPRQVGRISAINYIQKNYPDRNLNFLRMDFSSAHGDYFAIFEDENKKIYSFQLLGKYLPINVWSDPFKVTYHDEGTDKKLLFNKYPINSFQIYEDKIYMLHFDFSSDNPSTLFYSNMDGKDINELNLGLEFIKFL